MKRDIDKLYYRLKDGRMGPDHPPPSIDDLLSGRDVSRGR